MPEAGYDPGFYRPGCWGVDRGSTRIRAVCISTARGINLGSHFCHSAKPGADSRHLKPKKPPRWTNGEPSLSQRPHRASMPHQRPHRAPMPRKQPHGGPWRCRRPSSNPLRCPGGRTAFPVLPARRSARERLPPGVHIFVMPHSHFAPQSAIEAFHSTVWKTNCNKRQFEAFQFATVHGVG